MASQDSGPPETKDVGTMNDTLTREPSTVTPVISDHALERCEQMHISTKVAKRIWRYWSVRCENRNRLVVTSVVEPDYAVVVDVSGDAPVVVTVLFHVPEDYVREGDGYRVVGRS